ncbi:MAG: PadR family transcriptional regulator [Dehalococcoidales bacterium]|nr:PadR family transcriptional regulator [Dehalococcoidales bacterium]
MFNGRLFNRERIFQGPRRKSSFQKGDLKYILLDLIKDKPRHGYDVIRELEDRSHGFYKPSPGVIYPTLQMLEEMGYTSSAEEEGKKTYSITGEGLAFLAKKRDIANGVRSEMKHRWSFKNIGRMASVMKEYHELENLIGRGFRSLDADKSERIRQVLSGAYQEIEAILEE